MKTASTPIEPSPFVAVVDDDPSVRDALDSLFGSVGMSTYLFGNPNERARTFMAALNFGSRIDPR